MKVIRVCSLRVYLQRYLFAFIAGLILLFASVAVLADKPPVALLGIVSSNTVVHDQKCNFHAERDVECVMLYDDQRDILWIVLYDETKSGLAIYKIVAVHKKQEVVVWCRQDTCI